MTLIYKIASKDEWAAALAAGQFDGAPIDLADGYIHFSTAEQARETADKHFAGRDDLLLIALDDSVLGEALKWEPSRGGQLFPHLYRPFLAREILWAKPLPLRADGLHDFEGLTS